MTAPLVPPEVDLRDFPFMPLHIERLKRSRAWLLCKKTPELAFYMLNLWTASWHEVPAASLDDDDEVLADRALCAESKWAKVKQLVLRGWVKCADGRLYHPIVAEVALEAWKARLDQRARTAAATAAREAKRLAAEQQKQRDEQRNVNDTDERDDERDDVRDVKRNNNVTLTSRSPREAKVKGSEVEGRELQKRAVDLLPPEGPVDNSESTPPNVNIAIENIEKSKAKPNGGQQWDNPLWVNATATTLGKRRAPGMSDSDWKDSVYGALQAQIAQQRAGH